MNIKTTEEISVTPYEQVAQARWVLVDDEIASWQGVKAMLLSWNPSTMRDELIDRVNDQLEELSQGNIKSKIIFSKGSIQVGHLDKGDIV